MGHGVSLASATRWETLGAGTGTGTTVAAAGSSNVKGSYVTLGTASFDYDGLALEFDNANLQRYRFDVAVNNGGGDEIIAADVYLDGTPGFNVNAFSIDIPVAVTAGAVVKARCQSTAFSSSLTLLASGYQGDHRMLRGFRGLISCTDWTNTDPTNSLTMNGTTQTGWTQIVASTSGRVAGLYATLDSRGSGLTNGDVLYDIGWGSAGNEKVLRRIYNRSCTARTCWGPIPCDFPAGTRLAFRAQAAAANTNVVSLVLNGLAA